MGRRSIDWIAVAVAIFGVGAFYVVWRDIRLEFSGPSYDIQIQDLASRVEANERRLDAIEADAARNQEQ